MSAASARSRPSTTIEHTKPAVVGVRLHALIACLGPFGGGLTAEQAGEAVEKGLLAAGAPAADLLAFESAPAIKGAELARLLAEDHFDARMLQSRAVVLVLDRLQRRALAGGLTAEVATRARQSGVPAYAVVRELETDDFDARVLDLQTILTAADRNGLRRAGRKLAGVL